jgi:hypothetical protein
MTAAITPREVFRCRLRIAARRFPSVFDPDRCSFLLPFDSDAAMMLLALTICHAAARPWIRVSPLDAVRHN